MSPLHMRLPQNLEQSKAGTSVMLRHRHPPPTRFPVLAPPAPPAAPTSPRSSDLAARTPAPLPTEKGPPYHHPPKGDEAWNCHGIWMDCMILVGFPGYMNIAHNSQSDCLDLHKACMQGISNEPVVGHLLIILGYLHSVLVDSVNPSSCWSKLAFCWSSPNFLWISPQSHCFSSIRWLSYIPIFWTGTPSNCGSSLSILGWSLMALRCRILFIWVLIKSWWG